MSGITAAEWATLMAAHQDVEAAYRAYVEAPAFAKDALQARCERIGQIYERQQKLLLEIEPPTVGAAAYQLRLFALSCHLGDLAEPALPDEEHEIAALRQIWLGLTKLADGAAQAQ